jgi:gliding motility-associated lipoprotein GldD
VKHVSILFIFVLLLASGCGHDYQPKQKGYNRLELPTPVYTALPDTFPYRFEYSNQAQLLRDSSAFGERYWVMVYYPQLKANVHITYKKIKNDNKLLKEFVTDATTLTSKHQVKAYAIDETITRTPSGKVAVIAEIEGEVPSQFQFTMTDSTDNFLRGALYFDTKVQNDSLKPAIDYVKKDLMHMINTLEWAK